MKDLLKYLKEYRVKAVLAPLFKMLEAIFELMVPLVVARLIDKGIAELDSHYILLCGLWLLLLTFIGYGFSITAQYFAARAAIGFGKGLRVDLFRHINSLGYEEIDKLGTSTLITRMTSDVNLIVSGVNMFLRLFLRSPFIVFGAVIMAFTVDVSTSKVFLIILPVLVVIVCVITYASIPLYKKVQTKLDRVTLLTRESLIGIRVIRAFNRKEQGEEEFRDSTKDLMRSQLIVGRLSALMNPVTYLVVNVGIAMLIYAGAIKVNIGDLSQGQVVALVNYMSQILVELVKLANLIITLTKGMASARRISDVFAIKPSMEYGDKKVGKDITLKFENVSMNYSDSKENAISDISFVAKPGDTIGIIGGTGSGKSTLINLIPRFYDRNSGQILINDIDIKEYDKESLRKSIGIVPQKSVLFRGTVADNLRFRDSSAEDTDLEKALEIAQAKEFIDKYEDGVSHEVLQEGKNLSGGQRQRLCIARALVGNPKILIMDDSSSALDYVTESKLRKALMTSSKDRINIIVTQRASSIIDADTILVLDDGCAVGVGKHQDLLKTCDIYKEIYLTQFKEGSVSA